MRPRYTLTLRAMLNSCIFATHYPSDEEQIESGQQVKIFNPPFASLLVDGPERGAANAGSHGERTR